MLVYWSVQVNYSATITTFGICKKWFLLLGNITWIIKRKTSRVPRPCQTLRMYHPQTLESTGNLLLMQDVLVCCQSWCHGDRFSKFPEKPVNFESRIGSSKMSTKGQATEDFPEAHQAVRWVTSFYCGNVHTSTAISSLTAFHQLIALIFPIATEQAMEVHRLRRNYSNYSFACPRSPLHSKGPTL